MIEKAKITSTISSRPRIHVAEGVALARAQGGYFSGTVTLPVTNTRAELDVDTELELLRLALTVDGSLYFIETRLVAEPMPHGGVRRKGVCTTCAARTLVLYVSEDRRQLCCSTCVGVRYASRALSNGRRAWFEAAKVVARSGGAQINIFSDEAMALVPLHERARLRGNLKRIAPKYRALERAVTKVAGVSGSSDVAAFIEKVRQLVDRRVLRELITGQHDPSIRRLMERATLALRQTAELKNITKPDYWNAVIRERSARPRERIPTQSYRTPNDGSPPESSGGSSAIAHVRNVIPAPQPDVDCTTPS